MMKNGIYYYGEVDDANGATLIAETYGDPVKSSTSIGTIKLKVKKDVSSSTETITISSISVIDAEENYDLSEEASVKLTINTENSTNDESKNDSQVGNKNANNNQQKATTSNEPAPYTGVKEVTPIIFVVGIIATMAFIRFIKYKDIK